MKLFCNSCQHIFAAEFNKEVAEVPCPSCQAPVAMPENEVGPGVVVDGFLIEKELGKGGMGKVYIAKQISLDRPVAMKVLLDKFAQNREYVDGLVREARAAAKINHPNIVQSFAVGESDGVVYFAMELIRGETMKQRLKKEKILKFDEAAKIIRDIASALDVAWREQKLVHQDIKPDNIMLDINGFAKLADLGLAKTSADPEEEEVGDEVLGTPQYISPEQLTGVPTDVRSDMYSLGATFYQFVTGRFPYVADTGEQLAHMHVDGNLQPPKEVNPELPEELNAIIMKMMARDINKRYQSAALLIKALDVFLRTYHPQESTAVPKFNIKKGAAKAPAIKIPSIKAPVIKAPAIKAPAPTPVPAPAPEAEKAAEEEISIAVPAPVPVPVPVPAPVTEKTEEAEEEIGIAAPAPVPVPVPVPVTEEAEKTEKAEEKEISVSETAPAENSSSTGDPKAAEATEEAETPAPRRKKLPKWIWIVPLVILLLLGAAAGVWFFGREHIPFLRDLNLEKYLPAPSAKPPAPPAASQPATPAKPAEPPKPQTRKAFMEQITAFRADARAGKLAGEELLRAGDRFMVEFGEPITGDERLALTLFIEEFYAPTDETVRFAPARQELLEERLTQIEKREQEIQAEEERIRLLKEEENRRKSEAEAEKLRAEKEAKENLETERQITQKRLEVAVQEITPLRKEIAMAMKKAVAGLQIAELQKAVDKGKAYSLPLGLPGNEEKELLRAFQNYCDQALAEYKMYAAFCEKLAVVSPRRPVQLRGKHQLLTIIAVSPGKAFAAEADGSRKEIEISGNGMKRQFSKKLAECLNRDKKAPTFTEEQVRFFFDISCGDWTGKPCNPLWEQIVAAGK